CATPFCFEINSLTITSIMFSVYTEKRNLIESTKEFNWKNRRIGVILRVADVFVYAIAHDKLLAAATRKIRTSPIGHSVCTAGMINSENYPNFNNLEEKRVMKYE
ncbi:hypothetical protein L9F63_026583, partial [Diploptera punctata]